MKKAIFYLGIIVSLFIFTYIIIESTKPSLCFQSDSEGSFSLEYITHTKTETITPWLDEESGVFYFFLPSFAQGLPIEFPLAEEETLLLNDSPIPDGYRLNWDENALFQITSQDINAILAVVNSDNIPSMFIHTDHQNKELLYEDVNYTDTGNICIYTENGTLQYEGNIDKFSGRGNQTWTRPKKPFSLKLTTPAPLLGLEEGRNWVLLAMFYESTNLTSKLALDIASEMGLAYTSQSTWVDLYIDGEYAGLYLLAEQIGVRESGVDIYDLEKENAQINSNLDSYPTFSTENMKGYLLTETRTISGGYLIEKEFTERYPDCLSGFITDSNYSFVIKEPEHASKEQVDYIRNHFQTAENLIYANSDECFEYIDIESFAKKFLLEEFFYNQDANGSSAFFYKDINADLIYCGPAWDYDNAMCRNMTCTDYTGSLLDQDSPEALLRVDRLDWWQYLYNNETFYTELSESYASILPVLIEYRDTIIDTYADHICKASQMDSMRWDYTSHYFYNEYSNNVRHLKFFWAKRMEYLCKRWNIPCPKPFEFHPSSETHTVTFMIYTEEGSEIIETMEIPDGDCIEVLPVLPAEDWQPWFFLKPNMTLTDKIPIYEDIEVHSYRMY